MKTNSIIAEPKDIYAHDVLMGSSALLKLVKKGERDINLQFLRTARDIINAIEKEIESRDKISHRYNAGG